MTTQQFNALPKAEKKKLVAKDVLAQIKTGKYIPNTGSYIGSLQSDLKNSDKDIKSNFRKIEECRVCAVGSCILSTTKFANKLTFNDLEEDFIWERNKTAKKVKSLVSSVFTTRELALMERCFEGDTNCYTENQFDYYISSKDKEKCNEFYESTKNSDEALIKIMKQIVKEGKFSL